MPYGFDFAIPVEALPHRVNIEEDRPTATDAEGMPLQAVTVVYTALPALVAPMSAEEVMDFQGRGLTVSHRVFLGPLDDGTMPVVNVRQRVVFGARRFELKGDINEGELDVIKSLTALER